MLPVDFNRISEEHIEGIWYVQSKIINKSDPTSIFASANWHDFLPKFYKARNGVEKTGKWNIKRDDFLTRPYIYFDLESNPTQALITKLLYSQDGKYAQLTIYFHTGLELVLLKN